MNLRHGHPVAAARTDRIVRTPCRIYCSRYCGRCRQAVGNRTATSASADFAPVKDGCRGGRPGRLAGSRGHRTALPPPTPPTPPIPPSEATASSEEESADGVDAQVYTFPGTGGPTRIHVLSTTGSADAHPARIARRLRHDRRRRGRRCAPTAPTRATRKREGIVDASFGRHRLGARLHGQPRRHLLQPRVLPGHARPLRPHRQRGRDHQEVPPESRSSAPSTPTSGSRTSPACGTTSGSTTT